MGHVCTSHSVFLMGLGGSRTSSQPRPLLPAALLGKYSALGTEGSTTTVVIHAV